MSQRIVFVCTGNICRSPTAEAVLRKLAADRGMADGVDGVEASSAGIERWHVGEPPDARSQAHAQRRGYDLSAQRARHFTRRDFARFDQVIAMDAGHHERLRSLCPPDQAHKLRCAADFSPLVPASGVPDPYYGDASGFEAVLDMVESLCAGVLAEASAKRAPGS